MGIDLTTAGQNPSLSISLFAKLACFHEADLNRNRHLFHFRRWKIRSGESIKLDAAYLDAVLVPRSEGQDQDIWDS